jgi:beta-lactamase regulating signal transducer with metallopeptidase domain
MIALWMSYALLVALGFTVAGLVAERAARSLGCSVRFVWLTVLLLSAVVPFGTVLTGEEAATASVVRAAAATQPNVLWLTMVDRGLLYGWMVAVVLLVMSAGLGLRYLLRARRHWQTMNVHGGPVLVSRDFGPGVVALGRAQIVVPAWALELEADVQELLLRHEREHLRARDHWLVLGALVLLVLCLFNPMLWWQFSRLKLAIEMDCDARVLSGRQDVREYAALLLDVSERRRAAHLVFAAFATPPHAIERRIRMLLDRRKETRRLAGVLTAAGAVVIGILACETPDPGSPEDAVRSALGVKSEPPPPPPPQSEEPGTEIVCDREILPGSHVPIDACVQVQKRGGRGSAALRDEEKRSQLPPPPPPPPPPGEELKVTPALEGIFIEVGDGKLHAVAREIRVAATGNHYDFTAKRLKLSDDEHYFVR